MADWTKVEGAAKDAQGNYVALVGGKWIPASGAAKDANGNYVAMLDSAPVPEVKKEEPKPKSAMSYLGDANRATGNVLGGTLEAGLNLGSGMASSAVGGLYGAADLLTGGSVESAQNKIQGMQETFTYQPRLEAGKTIAKVATMPIEYGSKLGGYIGRNSELANLTGTTLGAESIGEAAVPIVATLFGGRGAMKSAKGATMPSMPNVPVVSDMLAGLRDVVRTRSKSGQTMLAKDYIKNQIVANPKEAALLADQVPKFSGELVQGSTVTTADALARANRAMNDAGTPQRFGGQFVALQDKLGKSSELTSKSNTTRLVQEKSRANLIEKGAGTDAEYQAAVNRRTAKAEPLYRAAEQSTVPVNANPAMKLIDSLLAKSTGRLTTLKPVLEQVKKGLTGDSPIILPKGMTAARSTPQEIISSIKGINEQLAVKENAAVRRELIGIKNVLEHQLGKVVPEYKAATKVFMEESKPINQMDLWRKLREKATSANEVETPGMFLKTIKNEQKLIKDATGFKRGKDLSDYFDPKQMTDALNVAKEMESNLTKKQMQGEVSLGDTQVVKSGNALPNVMMREATIANFLVNLLGKDANVPVSVIAYDIISNPAKFSALMKEVTPKQRKGIFKALKDIAATKETAAIASATQGQQQ